MPPSVHSAAATDIPSWLEIVRQVEALFGPMPMFDVTLKNGIADKSALCVRGASGAVVGGLLIGGTKPDHWIRWLAVRRSARGMGTGSALLKAGLDRCLAPCTISVATFGADIKDGEPARRLYERFGFVAGEMLARGPEGGSRQRFTLIRS